LPRALDLVQFGVFSHRRHRQDKTVTTQLNEEPVDDRQCERKRQAEGGAPIYAALQTD